MKVINLQATVKPPVSTPLECAFLAWRYFYHSDSNDPKVTHYFDDVVMSRNERVSTTFKYSNPRRYAIYSNVLHDRICAAGWPREWFDKKNFKRHAKGHVKNMDKNRLDSEIYESVDTVYYRKNVYMFSLSDFTYYKLLFLNQKQNN